MNEDAKDAARYRWMIRDGGCPFAETDRAWDDKESLDAAIDAAMAYEPRYTLTDKGRALLEGK